MIPSWYRSARGSGGGYFRDRALALQRAGWRVAMLAPDLYTPRDLRRGEVASGRGPRIRVEDDGVETWRRDMLVVLPRLPYRNAAMFALCGLKLFARYLDAHGKPDFVEAHGALNGGVAAWAIGRRWGIPYMLTEHSTAFAQGRLRWWERDLVRRVIAGAQHCLAVSPQLAELLSQQYLGSRWQYLPNPLGAAFVENADARQRDPAAPFVFVCAAHNRRSSLRIGPSPVRWSFRGYWRRSRCATNWPPPMPLCWPAMSRPLASPLSRRWPAAARFS